MDRRTFIAALAGAPLAKLLPAQTPWEPPAYLGDYALGVTEFGPETVVTYYYDWNVELRSFKIRDVSD